MNMVMLNNDSRWLSYIKDELNKFVKLMGKDGRIYDETGNIYYNSDMIVYTNGGYIGNFNQLSFSIDVLKIEGEHVKMAGGVLLNGVDMSYEITPKELVDLWNESSDPGSGHYILGYYTFESVSKLSLLRSKYRMIREMLV